MSGREAAVAALAELLRQTGAEVWRDTDLARQVPEGGLIKLAEGDSTATALLSPLRWEHEMACDLVVTVAAADEHARDAALDALLLDIGARIAADRTLGATVDWAEPTPPSFDALEIDGAAKTARLTVHLSFVTTATVLA